MVTKRRHRVPLGYLRDHRRKRKVRVPLIAERMGIERESVYRLERRAMGQYVDDNSFLDFGDLGAYAAAIGEENPLLLLYPPQMQSLDAMVANEPDEVRALAADIVSRLIAKK